jgi:hypothetical protein
MTRYLPRGKTLEPQKNLLVPSSLAESSQRKNPNPPRVLLEGGGGLGFIAMATVTYQDTSVSVVSHTVS